MDLPLALGPRMATSSRSLRLETGGLERELRRRRVRRWIGVARLLDVHAHGGCAGVAVAGAAGEASQRVPRRRRSSHPPPHQINEHGRAGHRRHGADGQFRRRDHGARQRVGQHDRDRAADGGRRESAGGNRCRKACASRAARASPRSRSRRSPRPPDPSAPTPRRTPPASRASRSRPGAALPARPSGSSSDRTPSCKSRPTPAINHHEITATADPRRRRRGEIAHQPEGHAAQVAAAERGHQKHDDRRKKRRRDDAREQQRGAVELPAAPPEKIDGRDRRAAPEKRRQPESRPARAARRSGSGSRPAPRRSKRPARKDRPADCAAAPEIRRPPSKAPRPPKCPARCAAAAAQRPPARIPTESRCQRPSAPLKSVITMSRTEIGYAPMRSEITTATNSTRRAAADPRDTRRESAGARGALSQRSRMSVACRGQLRPRIPVSRFRRRRRKCFRMHFVRELLDRVDQSRRRAGSSHRSCTTTCPVSHRLKVPPDRCARADPQAPRSVRLRDGSAKHDVVRLQAHHFFEAHLRPVLLR